MGGVMLPWWCITSAGDITMSAVLNMRDDTFMCEAIKSDEVRPGGIGRIYSLCFSSISFTLTPFPYFSLPPFPSLSFHPALIPRDPNSAVVSKLLKSESPFVFSAVLRCHCNGKIGQLITYRCSFRTLAVTFECTFSGCGVYF